MVDAHTSDDFTFSGPVPQPIGKEDWIGLQTLLGIAMPDFSFNISKVEEKGNVVRFTVAISGTQTQPLDLSMMGMDVIPASDAHVQLPTETVDVTVRGDKVTSVYVPVVAGGGVPGILSQLGVQIPH